MKTMPNLVIITLFIAVLTMSCQAATSATAHTDSTSVTNTREKIYKVSYRENEKKTIYVRVVNSRGDVIKRNYIQNKKGFVKAYDFEKLSADTYTIEVYDKGQLLTSQEVVLSVSQ